MSDSPLKMTFDPATIEHLGIRMYSTLPPVLAELISNGYDADASEVVVELHDDGEQKEIIVKDNGSGMAFGDINSKFLRIGRNRRDEDPETVTPLGRKVIGKKGLGKLSFFGIAGEIEITTRKDGKENVFIMRWSDIKSAEAVYTPEIVKQDADCEPAEHGTTIVLRDLRRASDFDATALAISLSKLFIVDNDFKITIQRNQENSVQVENDKKYEELEKEVEWDVPADIKMDHDYEKFAEVTGHLIATETPLSARTNMRGVTLFSRKKLVNLPEYFSESTSSHFFSYLTGWLEVDFIDDLDEDVISTDRQSLNWAHPDMEKLRDYLRRVMNWLEQDWRVKREAIRKKRIDEKAGINTEAWFSKLPEDIRATAESVVKAIVKDSEMPEEVGVNAVRDFHKLVPEYPKYHWRHLHPEVRDASSAYYEAGDYYHAFMEASKRYVTAVRTKAVITAGDERADMQKVFPEASPMLSVTEGYKKADGTDFTADTLKNIRVAHQMFSEGVICGGRHPVAHEEIVELKTSGLFTEDDCLDALSLLSHLFSRLEHSIKMR